MVWFSLDSLPRKQLRLLNSDTSEMGIVIIVLESMVLTLIHKAPQSTTKAKAKRAELNATLGTMDALRSPFATLASWKMRGEVSGVFRGRGRSTAETGHEVEGGREGHGR
jgi:hypothetical protein